MSRWLGLWLRVVGVVVAVGTVGACEDDDTAPAGTVDGGAADLGAVDVPIADASVPDGQAPDVGPPPDLGPATNYALTILHTNDLHSHLMGHAPEADYSPSTVNDDATVGGFARIATAIGMFRAEAMAANRDVLLLDGGDFMMGTLFQLAATKVAGELSVMQAVGYDAVAAGNHEFDWTPKGLAGILAAAVQNGVTMPVLASNVTFDPTSPDDDTLEQLKDPGPFRRKFIKTLPNGLKVGFFGLIGEQAQSFAPTAAPMKFTKPSAAALELVQELRTVDKVDLVIALSHSGIRSDGQGEDREIARVVNQTLGASMPGIDVIISGHTHETLQQPAIEGRTIIVTAGSYGAFLGRLELNVEKRGDVVTALTPAAYTLLPIDDKISGFAPLQAQIDALIAALDVTLAPLGVGYRTVVGELNADIKLMPFVESGLGNLVTDALLAAAQKVSPDPADLPQLAVEANGQIRADLLKGKTGAVWLADLYRVLPLGIGPDGMPGAPLVTYYLSGKDLRQGLEISAAAREIASNFTLQFSGIEADFNPKRLQFQRVTAVRLVTPNGTEPIDPKNTTKCYKIVTTLQFAGLLGLVNQLTRGILTVQPKEKDCVTPANIFTRLVDADLAAPGVQELKANQALLGFVLAFPDTDADMVPNIPDRYATPAGRLKIVE
jgi:5'-nucleotidase / UDP-sugar diphosphatase